MKNPVILLLSLLILALLLPASGCGSDDETTPTPAGTATSTGQTEPVSMGYTGGKHTFKFSHSSAVNTTTHMQFEYMSERLQYYTDGQVKLEIFPMGTLYSDFEVFPALSTGSCDMASVGDYVPPLNGLGDFFTTFIPWYFGTNMDDILDHLIRFIQHPDGGQNLMKQLEQNNIKGLGILPGSYTQICCTNTREIKTTEDLAGLKWHSVGGMTQLMLDYLDGNGVVIDVTEVQPAFEQGLIDIFASSPSAIYQQKRYETIKYAYIMGILVANANICMSLDLWEDLSPELQDIIMNKVMPEVFQWNLDNLQGEDAECIELLREKGMIIHVQPDEERTIAREAVLAMPETEQYFKMMDPAIIALIDELR